MATQRSSRRRSFLTPLSLSAAAAGLTAACFFAAPTLTGCGGSSSDASATSAGFDPSMILDEYVATGEVPAVDGITKIVFVDESNYALKKTTGSEDGEAIAMEYGTYAIDTTSGILTLTDSATGTPRALPFQAVTSEASIDGSDDLGLVGGALSTGSGTALSTGKTSTLTFTAVCTVTINSQTFQATNISCKVLGGDGGVLTGSGSGSTLSGAPTSGSSGAGSSGAGSSGSPSSGSPSSGSSGAGSGGGSSLSNAPDGGVLLGTPGGQGVDVSDYQPGAQWTQVHAQGGKSFAYAKATEGTTWTGKTFAPYYAALKAAGMQRGAYHFFRASSDPTAQAMHFASVLKAAGWNAGTDLAPALDVELVPGLGPSSAAGVQTFLNVAQAQLGVGLIIYTDIGDWARIGNPTMAGHPLWIANVGKGGAMATVKAPKLPPGWTTYSIWQNSWTGKVPGINGNVDTDIFPLAAGTGG